ncbi:MAG: vitamin B12 dependent-methionine synthase activation domain-containing protein [Phascolarctobacterium sp.]|nr:vitamin B12 dependent-methionine synthase activation domain-containing protein [Phascolarctobacterium sp.]MEE1230108.1 vitamin B12 dependent-methionine synthase activation domain-containing protein [Phascolarctobacterium sp.]
MDFNRREALRYLRARPDDKEAQLLVDTVYLKLRNEVQARHVLQKHRVAVDATGVTLESGTRFNSRDLAAHLKGCEEALLLGATLGSRVDAAIRRLALGSVAEGAAAQAVAAALIESYCDEVQARFETGGLAQRPRFSPGYGDWDLAEQKLLFPVLNCAKLIGLTLTEGCMMAPSKSVTAVIGLSTDVQCVWNKCMICGNINCPYRASEE